MKIGVVCEGPTDYPAIEHFFGGMLKRSGIAASFMALFPEMDRTRPQGGWSNVLSWLQKYPASTRIQRFFGGGLFGGSLSSERLDLLLVHLDSDVLEDASFKNYIWRNMSIQIDTPADPQSRATKIREILECALEFEKLSDADIERHLIVPAVESTEAWCVAAFHPTPINAELLRGEDLINAFMDALERSESRAPKSSYSKIDKSLHRREKFIRKHAENYERVFGSCPELSKCLTVLSKRAI